MLHYTCILSAVPEGDGDYKFRVRYAPMDRRVRAVFMFRGTILVPEPVEVFEGIGECNVWADEMVRQGYERVIPLGGLAAPLESPHAVVTVERTYEDELPRGKLAWSLDWVAADGGEETLAVELVNEHDRPMPMIGLALAWTTQPHSVEGAPARINLKAFSNLVPFNPETPATGTAVIRPGCRRRFRYPLSTMAHLRDLATFLPHEEVWVSIRTSGYEFDRIPGSELMKFLAERWRDRAAA